jgi:HK97 family phage major capsid protein
MLTKERGGSRTLDAMLGLPARESAGYSLTRLAASMLQNRGSDAPFERDIDAFVTSRTGQVAGGRWVPLGMLSKDFSVGTAGEAGNLVGVGRHTAVSGDPLRPVTVLGSLPVTTIHGLQSTTAVPMFNSSSNPAIVTEIGAATEILTTTESADLTPFTIRIVTEFARQALVQSSADLERAFSRQLSAAIFNKMESVILAGDGAGDNPTGIVHRSDVNIIAGGTDGLAMAWSHLAALEKGAHTANIAPGASSFLVNSKVNSALRTTTRGSGLDYLMPDHEVLGHPVAVTNNLPSNLAKGTGSGLSAAIFCADWSQLCIGFYGPGIDLTIDPISKAQEGKVRVIASVVFGFGLLRPTAFSVMKDIIAA